ncbi:hypothetical protein ACQ7UY_005328 [Escherichia coli]
MDKRAAEKISAGQQDSSLQ